MTPVLRTDYFKLQTSETHSHPSHFNSTPTTFSSIYKTSHQRTDSRMSRLRDQVSGAFRKGKDTAHDVKSMAEDRMFDIPYVDLTIQFIGARDLPKMDVVGSADPYFIAKLDNKISMVSTVKPNTLTPTWNELWHIKNVPMTANLNVEVWDKDDGALKDDHIGNFSTSINAGAKEVEIEGALLKRHRGTFWLKIDSTPSTSRNPRELSFIFDGPIRFSKHFSPTVGFLTNLNDARLYATWKMYIKGVRLFFGDTVQPWNRGYKAAQAIFQGPSSVAVRASIQAGHRMLYARSTTNGFGIIENKDGIYDILHGGQDVKGGKALFMHRIKPAVYTYIISAEDDSFRFSETGAAFFVDFASKHALHANCAEAVRYSGEFHPRPKGGWQNFRDEQRDEDVEWELVIDNNSGTYSPDAMLLPNLKACLDYNFPGFTILALDFHDPALKESTDACRAYATSNRGVDQDELQPHVHHAGEGEVTLMHQASVRVTRD